MSLQVVFDDGESLLDGIQIGTIGWQENDVRAPASDGVTHGFRLVATEVVEDDDVALVQGWG